jgi:hypothetical protein
VNVTFVKKHRRYDVHVARDRATDLFIRSAPGYDEWLDDVAAQWHSLPDGDSLTLEWPRRERRG